MKIQTPTRTVKLTACRRARAPGLTLSTRNSSVRSNCMGRIGPRSRAMCRPARRSRLSPTLKNTLSNCRPNLKMKRSANLWSSLAWTYALCKKVISSSTDTNCAQKLTISKCKLKSMASLSRSTAKSTLYSPPRRCFWSKKLDKNRVPNDLKSQSSLPNKNRRNIIHILICSILKWIKKNLKFSNLGLPSNLYRVSSNISR